MIGTCQCNHSTHGVCFFFVCVDVWMPASVSSVYLCVIVFSIVIGVLACIDEYVCMHAHFCLRFNCLLLQVP